MKTFHILGLSLEEIQELSSNAYLSYLEKAFHTNVVFRNEELIVADNAKADAVHRFFQKTIKAMKGKYHMDEINLDYIMEHLADETDYSNQPIGKTVGGKIIYPKTSGQRKLFDAMRHYDVLVAIGPAGTGKTYLSVIYATSLLKENVIKKIILTRPAVEAGENLGFLPGDLKEKVDPYLRPLYDALYEMLPAEMVDKKLALGEIEIAPLAFMRGRTLSNSFIILDEAQNTTPMQMKMFLTRLGENSRMVVNGDLSQVDLPSGTVSGLRDALSTLKHLDNISSVTFSSEDVVRHGLVAKIVRAYEEKSKRTKEAAQYENII